MSENINQDCYFFWGGFCSNWHPVEFKYKNINFFNSEQAFMWEKAMYFDDAHIAQQIGSTTDPAKAKKLGRLVDNFDADAWSEVSYQIMYNVNLAKFEQNPELKNALISTQNKILVEASPYDKIWGIGLNKQQAKITPKEEWKGTNWLGEVLVEVREYFKKLPIKGGMILA